MKRKAGHCNACTQEALHGHNYQVQVSLKGRRLKDGVLLDFGVVKPLVKALCNSLHNVTLLPERSSYLQVGL